MLASAFFSASICSTARFMSENSGSARLTQLEKIGFCQAPREKKEQNAENSKVTAWMKLGFSYVEVRRLLRQSWAMSV